MISVGTVLEGRYEVERLLARGGMADVFVAHDRRLDRSVAVKAVRGAAAEDRTRFQGETRLLAALDHPSLIRLLDGGEHEDDAYLILEFVDGETLTTVLERGPLSPERVSAIGLQLADGLAYIHARGVVHRDVKPSNILMAVDGRSRLGDFGIARLLDDTRLTRTGTTVGTAAYLAPEQLEGQAESPADIYALGLVLLECLNGAPCFPGSGPEVALARLARDPVVPATLPAPWPTLLASMTNRDPRARPPADDVAHAIWGPGAPGAPTVPVTLDAATEVFASPAPVTARPGPGRPLAGRPRQARFALAALLGVILLAVIGIVGWRAQGGATPSPRPTTTVTSGPAISPPATAAPVAPSITIAPTCDQLRAQRHALDEQQHQIDEQHKGPSGEQLKKDLEAQKRALDAALRACH